MDGGSTTWIVSLELKTNLTNIRKDLSASLYVQCSRQVNTMISQPGKYGIDWLKYPKLNVGKKIVEAYSDALYLTKQDNFSPIGNTTFLAEQI